MFYSQTVVQFLSVLTVIAQIISVALIVLILMRHKFLKKISRHALVLMLIVSLVATVGSLFFSEIAMWNPCKYCWLQRIFMYPQVLLLGIAVWKKDTGVAKYILGLSVIGAVLAVYHYGIQVDAALNPVTENGEPCDLSGESCASTPFFHFGYITIPMMALSAFVLNILGSVVLMRRK